MCYPINNFMHFIEKVKLYLVKCIVVLEKVLEGGWESLESTSF